MSLEISIAAEPLNIFGITAITNSLFTTVFVSSLFIALAFAVSKIQLKQVPGGHTLQNILEVLFEGFLSFYASIVGQKRARLYFPLLTTVFFYILFSNWIGLLPGVGTILVPGFHNGHETMVPLLRAPTADLNTTFALAIIAFIFIQYEGLKALKANYLKKFFNFSSPIFTFVGLLEFLGEFTKVVSFAFRLFGNIFAGEVLLAVMSFLFPVILSIPFLGLEVFVGMIQALVFVMLMLVFTASATADHH